MDLISVKSSNISQVGYDENYKLTINSRPLAILRVVFTSGFVYDYYNVPKDVYEALINAESIGKYFHANIKNDYEFEKVK